MSSSLLEKRASNFILTYLSELRHTASVIPQKDRGYFPQYWFGNNKITILSTELGDLAIFPGRPVSYKRDTVNFRASPHRIEKAIFPSLDYSLWPMFNVGSRHHTSIGHMTLVTNGHPFFNLSSGGDIKIIDVRFESSSKIRGFPSEKKLLWLFSNPTNERVSADEARKEAFEDFWNYLEWLVFTKLPDFELFADKLTRETISLLQDAIKNLADEYERLITRVDLEEWDLQIFLEQHFLLLSPDRRVTKEKRKVGTYIPDFILRYEDGSFTMVEIQLNRDPIFRNNEPSDGMKEAITQISNWFEWIKRNTPSELIKASGLIVIGRRSSYEKHRQKIDDVLSKIGYPVKLVTYDDLKVAFDKLIQALFRA